MEYRVITKQYVYNVATVKARNKEEAKQIALENDTIDWDWCDYGDVEIDFIEEA